MGQLVPLDRGGVPDPRVPGGGQAVRPRAHLVQQGWAVTS
jgi:hypothetical protein